jgi:sugar phosphate isomerase/epimerase
MLGYAEFCVPGKKLEERLQILEGHGLWLEMICRKDRDLGPLDSFKVEVRSVQAYLLHHLSLLSRDKAIQKAAINHVEDAIKLAGKAGAGYVVTVPTYGFSYVKNPLDRCVEVFRGLSSSASEHGVDILIEALGPKRTSFLPSLREVDKLVKAIDRRNIGLLADTRHIFDSEGDVVKTLKEFKKDVVELHLKDTGSRPPGKGELDFKEILDVCRGPLLCLEYRSNLKEDFEETLRYLRGTGYARNARKP